MLSANISGLDSAAWDDLVTLTGVHLTVRGTAAQDTIEVAPGTNHRLTINGASRDYAARAVEQVTILAAAGDTANAGAGSTWGSGASNIARRFGFGLLTSSPA